MDPEKHAKDAYDEFDNELTVDPHQDRTRENRVPSFSRMNADWEGPNADHVRDLIDMAENAVAQQFPMVFALMHELYDIVREPKVDPQTGEIEKDRFGWTVYRKNRYGVYVEDWNRLTRLQREYFIMRISTSNFQWEQDAQNLWAKSMFAKAAYEDAFADGFVKFQGEGRSTVDARSQAARLYASTDRYRGIYFTLVSRKAEALVRSMNLILQRLKDVYVA